MNKLLFVAMGIVVLSISAAAKADIANAVFDDTSMKLMDEIKVESKKHAIYSYNIANASTPGFKPIRIQSDDRVGGVTMQALKDEVSIDEELAKLTKSRLRHGALYKLLGTKMQIYKRMFSLGKGG